MEALRWNQQHPESEAKLVPYRESKVTHIFRDVLHGWGRLVLSVSVSPGASDYDESHNVLKVRHPIPSLEILLLSIRYSHLFPFFPVLEL